MYKEIIIKKINYIVLSNSLYIFFIMYVREVFYVCKENKKSLLYYI